jgi:hypothetical protein
VPELRLRAAVLVDIIFFEIGNKTVFKTSKATPHNSARANPEKNWVLTMAVFRRNTLCILRKSDEVRAQFFQEAPMADCAVLP